MIDFSHTIYIDLIEALKNKKSSIITFKDFISLNRDNMHSKNGNIIIRHDVDRNPFNALKIAKIESELNIKASYYFRIVPESYDVKVISEIAKMGHEIGYHYEDVDLVVKSNKDKLLDRENLINKAYLSFCNNLAVLRKDFDIHTICMHGSPLSKYDNRIIWEKYSYNDLGIIGEPYFDLNYNDFAYFTDTGRRWDGHKFSIRDKVDSRYKFNFKSTQEIISNLKELPDNLIFNIHPERWENSFLPWMKNLIFQKVKNSIKYLIILKNKKYI